MKMPGGSITIPLTIQSALFTISVRMQRRLAGTVPLFPL
jgi:hypothetical protein